jgi:hypothetical protein
VVSILLVQIFGMLLRRVAAGSAVNAPAVATWMAALRMAPAAPRLGMVMTSFQGGHACDPEVNSYRTSPFEMVQAASGEVY